MEVFADVLSFMGKSVVELSGNLEEETPGLNLLVGAQLSKLWLAVGF